MQRISQNKTPSSRKQVLQLQTSSSPQPNDPTFIYFQSLFHCYWVMM
ncbi:hypothetical protein MtrunA17_Chr2g0333511 [Medicago truncatula]|uniref:Uncharacterized protein n=1 Tax=Medicago truncatula TaxID=3880 RepID=A0A396JHE0_MEDTR|nr:hypothetical protein MtrunA17_Chr2g0333511 [Medicago truncatula]